MAAFLALRSVRRKQKQCRQENPLQRPENEVVYEYRLNKAAIMELCDLLREDLKPTLCSSRVLTMAIPSGKLLFPVFNNMKKHAPYL